MKVLALNGSPRMRSSSTYHMLAPLLEGMQSAGAETEIVHLRKLDIRECIGCYTCWVRTPGKCIFHTKDKMASLLEQYNEADLVIFGTPLYHFSMSGFMKNFIDRTLVRIEPWLIPHPDIEDLTFHPERFQKPRKMMLVSPCGFPEFSHFDSLVATFRQMARMERMDYVGEILRPQGETLSSKAHQPLFDDYYEKLRVAGAQIITDGAISSAAQAALNEDLFPVEKEVFYSLAENYWTQQMDRFKVPQEQRRIAPLLAAERDSVHFVDSIDTTALEQTQESLYLTNEQLAMHLAEMYQGDVIPDLKVTVQLSFSNRDLQGFDAGPLHWFLVITDGDCFVHAGVTPVPTLTINTPNEVWHNIGAGKLDAVEAFTDGLYEAEGSMTLLALLPDVFNYPRPT